MIKASNARSIGYHLHAGRDLFNVRSFISEMNALTMPSWRRSRWMLQMHYELMVEITHYSWSDRATKKLQIIYLSRVLPLSY